jgi:hypothetical protein
VVRLFLEKRIDINTENEGNQIILYYAVARERPNININIKNDGMAVMKLFLKKKTDINRTN